MPVQELEDLEIDEVALLSDEAEPAVEEAEIVVLKEDSDDEEEVIVEEDEEATAVEDEETEDVEKASGDEEDGEVEKAQIEKGAWRNAIAESIKQLEIALEEEKDAKRKSRLKMILGNLKSMLSTYPSAKRETKKEADSEEAEVAKAGKRISSAVKSDLDKALGLLKQAEEIISKLSQEPSKGKGYPGYYPSSYPSAYPKPYGKEFYDFTKELADNFSLLSEEEIAKVEGIVEAISADGDI